MPARLRAQGLKTAKLVFVGVFYSGFANAQLVATHPELRPAALIMVDSYLDLPARYLALPPGRETKSELERAIGGTLAQRPQEYGRRSPSNNLTGLAAAIRSGMRFVDERPLARATRRSPGAAGHRLRDGDATRPRPVGPRSRAAPARGGAIRRETAHGAHGGVCTEREHAARRQLLRRLSTDRGRHVTSFVPPADTDSCVANGASQRLTVG